VLFKFDKEIRGIDLKMYFYTILENKNMMTLIIENILDWGLKEKIIYYYELIMDEQKVKYNPDVTKTEKWFDYKKQQIMKHTIK